MQNRINVYIVDDNEDLTKLLADALAQFGDIHVAGVSNSGHEAILRIQQCKADVVLLDIIMPRMDGLQVLSRIKSSMAKCPAVVMLTAIGGEAILARARKLGADDILIKPADVDTIAYTIRAVYERNRQRG